MKKVLCNLLSALLTVILSLNLIITSFASTLSRSPLNEDIKKTEIIWGNNYIEEYVEISINGDIINILRTTYNDNTCILKITEKGTVTTSKYTTDYKKLYEILKDNSFALSATARGRVDGYTYDFMKTVTQTEYYKVENATYAMILSGLSSLLAPASIPLSVISSVASALYGLSGGNVDAKYVIYRNWYEVTETASGEYISYYCEWNLHTYAKHVENGSWVSLGVERGDFNSFDIY